MLVTTGCFHWLSFFLQRPRDLDFFIQMSEMSQKHVQAKRFHMRNHRHKNLDWFCLDGSQARENAVSYDGWSRPGYQRISATQMGDGNRKRNSITFDLFQSLVHVHIRSVTFANFVPEFCATRIICHFVAFIWCAWTKKLTSKMMEVWRSKMRVWSRPRRPFLIVRSGPCWKRDLAVLEQFSGSEA